MRAAGRGFAFLVLAFLYTPILVMVVYSFNSSRLVLTWEGVSLRWYGEAFGDPVFSDALITSLLVAVSSALLAGCLGTFLAVGMKALPETVQGLLGAVMILTIVTPEVLVGLSALLFFIRLNIPLGLDTIVPVHVVFGTSIVAFLVRARLAGFGSTFEDASSDLGAVPLYTFRRVTLPLLGPAILAGMLLAFTLSFDNFLITFFTAGTDTQTLPLVLWGLVRFGVSPVGNAVASVVICGSLILISVAIALNARQGQLAPIATAAPVEGTGWVKR